MAPAPALSERGKKIHYDALRASVITSVSASVIALASGRGLPVSTTYVAFAAVVATGLADRVMARGDADLKIGRAIWVITSWFLAALFAMAATAFVARMVYHLSILGLVVALALNLTIRLLTTGRPRLRLSRRCGTGCGLRRIATTADRPNRPAAAK